MAAANGATEASAESRAAASGEQSRDGAPRPDASTRRRQGRRPQETRARGGKRRPTLKDTRTGSSSRNFSAEEFFATQEPPASLSRIRQQAQAFVEQHEKAGRRVVLVTSGGTTVPLEQNVVRFLDNFSAGTRGATSAEYFLSAGYAVIFMHRQHSLSPYTRHYSHTTNPFLDLLSDASDSSGSTISVKKEHEAMLHPVLKSYHEAQRAGTLLRLNFVTVSDYLFMLRELSSVMQSLGRRGMYYLAAAVSDFYVPSQKTPEHKIQSGKGSLVIEMDQVPKVLKPMVQEWAPEGYVVSFKLETDENMLIPKARTALERYGHQVVIGNDLNRRKYEVVFVERLASGDFRESWLRLQQERSAAAASSSDVMSGASGEREIEEDIVANLSARHQAWIDGTETRLPVVEHASAAGDKPANCKPGTRGKRRGGSRSGKAAKRAGEMEVGDGRPDKASGARPRRGRGGGKAQGLDKETPAAHAPDVQAKIEAVTNGADNA